MRRWRPKARQAPALLFLTSFVIKRQQIHTPAPSRAGDSALIMFTAETYCCVRSRRSRHGPPGTFPRPKGSGSSIIEAYLWKGSGEQRELKPATKKKRALGSAPPASGVLRFTPRPPHGTSSSLLRAFSIHREREMRPRVDLWPLEIAARLGAVGGGSHPSAASILPG